MAAPQRNAPCPCGSGLRYKHCHGANAAHGSTSGAQQASTRAPYPGWEAFAPEDQTSLWSAMQDALAAQKSGQLETASDLYSQVVARAPLTFDALHMLGVVKFQQGDLDEAESLLRRASDLMPDFAAIRNNLLLLQQRKREQEGLYSATAIIAYDMLRLFGAASTAAAPTGKSGRRTECGGQPERDRLAATAFHNGSDPGIVVRPFGRTTDGRCA
jgi:tetratricopeptide (TPR) repeat protein